MKIILSFIILVMIISALFALSYFVYVYCYIDLLGWSTTNVSTDTGAQVFMCIWGVGAYLCSRTLFTSFKEITA